MMKKLIKFYKKLSFFQGMAFAIAFTSLLGIAATVNGLNMFTPGTTISSAQMNTNFNILKTAIESTGSQTYIGVYNASTGITPGGGSSGDYYVITTAGTIGGVAYAVNDWIIFNGTTWGKIPSNSTVASVFGRTGVVAPMEGDYSLNLLSDVNLTSPTPTSGDVLKFDGTQWRPAPLTFTETDPSTAGFARVSPPTCTGGQFLFSNGTALTCVTGTAAFSGSASKAVVTDAAGALQTSTTTSAEIGYLAGLAGPIQSQLSTKEALITASTTAKYFRGDKTFVTLDTSVVPESTNLYFTNARVLGSTLTGFSSTPSTITATDTILQAFNKTQGQLDNKMSSTGATITTGTYNFAGTSAITVLSPVGTNDVVPKNYVDSAISANGIWSKSSTNIYYLTGNVGIGTSTPTASLDVSGNVNIAGTLTIPGSITGVNSITTMPGSGTSPALRSSSSSTTGIYFPTANTIGFSVSGVEKMHIDSSGYVGIGVASPAYKLDVVGDINASQYVKAGGVALSSDRRLKKNITQITNALEKILGLRGVEFDWKNNNTHDTGVIAQEVEQVFPNLVLTDAKGMKSVKYSNMAGIFIESTKELNNKISELEVENKMLKSYLCEKDPNAPFCE